MIEAIAIPIEIHDRFSSVLDQFQDSVQASVSGAQQGKKAFEDWNASSQSLKGTAVSATTAWNSFSKASTSVSNASKAASFSLDKTANSLDSVGEKAGSLGSVFDEFGDAASASAGKLLASAGAYLKAGKSLSKSLVSGFTDTLSGLMSKAQAKVEKIFTSAFSRIQDSISGSFAEIFQNLSTVGLGAISGLFSKLSSAVGNFFKKIFSKPTAEEYAKSSSSALATEFGIALTTQFEAVIMKSAEQIAAVTGKEARRHMEEAKWMPDTMDYIISQIDDFSASVQDHLASSLEDHTKAVLINIMGMSESEAAQAMAGTFENIVGKSLESGNALSDEMMRMLDWAQRMGAEIEVPAEAFERMLQEIIKSGDVGSEKFDNLIKLADQLGVSLEDGFKQGVDTLQAQLDNVNSQIIGIFESELKWLEKRQSFKRDFVQDSMKELQALDSSLSKEEARALAVERYQEMQEKVSSLFDDGVVTLDELRSATEGMTREEKKKFTELAKQRQERAALRREAEQEAKLRETQRKLVEGINKLVKAMGGEFVDVTKTMATFQGSLDQVSAPDLGITGQLRDARRMLALFKKDLKNVGGKSVLTQPVSGQGGFDYLFHGPATGYPVPVVLHGSERLTAIPTGRNGPNSQVVFNVSIRADSSSSGRTAGEAFVRSIQQALDTKRLRVPQFSIDSTRV